MKSRGHLNPLYGLLIVVGSAGNSATEKQVQKGFKKITDNGSITHLPIVVPIGEAVKAAGHPSLFLFL
jgi:hypothetical protein